jgi:hypothetical protein
MILDMSSCTELMRLGGYRLFAPFLGLLEDGRGGGEKFIKMYGYI